METTTKEQQAAQRIYTYTLYELRKGERADKVRRDLVSKGVDEQLANSLVRKGKQQLEKDGRKQGQTEMIWGIILLVGGLVITGLSYAAAGANGSFLVTTGAIIVGAVKTFRGMSKVSDY